MTSKAAYSEDAQKVMKESDTEVIKKLTGLVEQLEQKANNSETVHVYVWFNHMLYAEVRDCRKEDPLNVRFLVSFDTITGKVASRQSQNHYAVARRGWKAFMEKLTTNFQFCQG